VPLVTAQQLIDAGVHYGHQASRWNPKMQPYIHGKRHKIHIINLEETIKGLYRATHFLRHLAATGGQILFLGTKKQIRAVGEPLPNTVVVRDEASSTHFVQPATSA
jgi:small subunit ribosomal protein S2